MHRIDTSTVEADKFGAGKDGFTNGDPGVTPPTEVDDDWLDGVQEELASWIVFYGGLVKDTRHQVFQALARTHEINAILAWSTRSPAGAYSGDFKAVASTGAGGGGGVYPRAIAVGTSGEIEYSDDGVTWVAATAGGAFAGTFYGVSGYSSPYVAVGGGGEIQSSSTVSGTWTQRTAAGSYSGDFRDVIRTNNATSPYVAVGTGGEIQTSSDGVTWTARTAAGSFSGTFYAIGYDWRNGLYVAVGSGGEIQTSTDGVTWTAQSAAASYSGGFVSVTHNGDFFIAVGTGATEVQLSADGVTWGTPSHLASNYRDVMATPNGLVVAVGDNGSGDVWFEAWLMPWTSSQLGTAVRFNPALSPWSGAGSLAAVEFVNRFQQGSPRFGVAVGDSGLILSTAWWWSPQSAFDHSAW